MATEKEYDLVVFGATGFTGKYVAEELYRIQTEGKHKFTWAVAGRNEDKVRDALTDLGIENVDVIVADINDQDSLDAMCGRTRVVIDVVGPYVLYGEQVVKSCISQRCDYVDITGETYFIESIIARYGEAAKDAGVYIVNCCGFDSVPNDIGTVLLQKSINGTLAYIESYVSVKANGFNIGTWESMIRSIQSYKALNQLRKSHASSRPTLPNVRMPKRRNIFYSNVTNAWCIPFTGSDRACMLRTAQHFHETEDTPMVYFSVGTFFRVLGLIMMFMFIMPLTFTRWGTKLLLKYPDFFSAGMARKNGLTRKEIENSSFNVTLDGAGYSSDNKENSKPDVFMRVKVRGAEPGYISTSALLVQCALCLINERANLPTNGGIYSPGAAFGKTNIIQNLEQTGKVRFTVEQI